MCKSIAGTLVWLCLSFLLTGCNIDLNALTPSNKSEFIPSGGLRVVEADLLPFDSISVHGPFDVDLRYIPGQFYMHAKGDSATLDQMVYYVKDDVLHVFVNQEFNYLPDLRILLTIEMPTLDRIYYHGPGRVESKNVVGSHLVLDVVGSGFVYLEGKVTRFDATLSGTSRLNAKCLEARTIFVNTVGLAQAEVANNGTVSALAADASDIYYYENPILAVHYENTSGSVLRMEGITPATPALPPPPQMLPVGVMAPAPPIIVEEEVDIVVK